MFSGSFFFDYFVDAFSPYAGEFFKMILYIAFIRCVYYVMRSDIKSGVTNIRNATIGYIIFKFATIFITIVDNIANQVSAGFGGGM